MCDGNDVALLAVADRDEDLSGRGQRIVDGELRLGIGARKVAGDTHDLTRRLHLGPEHGLGTREAPEGHDGLLAGVVAHVLVTHGQAEIGNALACHDAHRILCQRHARRLAHEGHGATRARIDLDDVDLPILDGKLDVDQAPCLDGEGELPRVVDERGKHRIRKREGRRAACGVPRMDAGFLDVLEYRADVDILAVA